MKYVGIDLGTTNSAIASFDGVAVALYKSPEQQDVTPSVLFVDRRGNKYVGSRAANNAVLDPDNAALLFKRQMGTSTPFRLKGIDRVLTPEECSAEVLRAVYGYLPDEIRRAEGGTVITVPAAFNQMQKDATLAAAELAGIGSVALMQEPVAAVMSVMRKRQGDGVFLIYDLGGGTLDVAVAQSIAGTVSLLAQGGIAMCGGRDFDRLVVDNLVWPWLRKTFGPLGDPDAVDQKRLVRLASWAAEKAKIELSQRDSATISLSETEVNRTDSTGHDIYLDIPITRSAFDELIALRLDETIAATRATITKTGLDAADIDRVVFVGGPTLYAPLRDRVAFELGISASTDVNPMTAVAEGAAIFAESIDWGTVARVRKSSRGSIASEPLALSFHFSARTPSQITRVSARLEQAAKIGSEFQIDSMDTGWSSGRLPLRDGAAAEVPLAAPGDNVFRILVYDASGQPLPFRDGRITITRTAATVEGIPASHSIGVEVRDRLGGRLTLDYLVHEGELLPKKGVRLYKAEESLRPGDSRSINFKLWEGQIPDPITDNNFIGVFSITGNDLGDQMIPAGAELRCEYEMLDLGVITLEVHVAAASGTFNSGRNLYSRQEGQINFEGAGPRIRDECSSLENRIDSLSGRVPDADLRLVKLRVESAERTADENSAEAAKQASEYIQDAKRLLSVARAKHLTTIREMELESVSSLFNECVRPLATTAEVDGFDRLGRTAETLVNSPDSRFETILDEMRGKTWSILWRDDAFIVDRLRYISAAPHLLIDPSLHASLSRDGEAAIARGDFVALRRIVAQLEDNRVGPASDADLARAANIVRS